MGTSLQPKSHADATIEEPQAVEELDEKQWLELNLINGYEEGLGESSCETLNALEGG